MDFNSQEMFVRIIKYFIEGLVVGIVASILPDKPLSAENIVLIGLTAAAMFSILDLVAPSISTTCNNEKMTVEDIKNNIISGFPYPFK